MQIKDSYQENINNIYKSMQPMGKDWSKDLNVHFTENIKNVENKEVQHYQP